MGLLRPTADQLAVYLLWYLLCRRFRALDVYHQELPIQHGLSDGESELCDGYVCSDDLLPRADIDREMGRRVPDSVGMRVDSEIEIIKCRNMLRSFLIIVTCLSALSVMGQTKLTSEQEKQVLAKMEQSSNALRTLQCDFVQTKRMKLLSKEMQSKGVLYFVKPDKIRWQYTTPYDYTFIMNGDKVQIKSAKSTKNIDIQGNKIFRQITTIILNTVTGGGIMNSADFDVTLFKQGEVYFAKMLPKKKEVKQVYASIEVYFNPTLTMVESIKMIEKSGEYTTVKLLSPKVNTTINESVFKVN